MQEGTRHLLKLESTGDCPRTNNGAHLIEMPDEVAISKGRLPWCVQCGIEFNRTEAELLAIVFATLPAAAVRDALAELWADALRLPTADYSTDGDGAELIKQDAVLKLIDAAMTALGLDAEGEKRK